MLKAHIVNIKAPYWELLCLYLPAAMCFFYSCGQLNTLQQRGEGHLKSKTQMSETAGVKMGTYASHRSVG